MKAINTFLIKKKKFISIVLVLCFLVAIPQVADRYWATSAQDKKDEAEGNLKDVQDEINDIKDKQDEVQSEIKDVRKKLSNLMSKQDELEKEINATQKEITTTQEELAVAQADAQTQYEAMKVRIKFMYENGSNDNIWTAIIESNGIVDMLNRVEYISTIYKSDRALTEQYKATVEMVEEKEKTLLAKMDELLMKQETFLGQQAEIKAMVASLEDSQDEYAAKLAYAKKQEEEYKKIIKEQEEIIRQQQAANNKPYYPGGKNVSGQTVVNYALQFVGNPYVWGGNSLTKGCDCSGFVHQVYKYFGYNLVRYSLSFLYEGVAVSKSDMKPGDIVVYPRNSEGIGHVAIYMGNGLIVEAQSTKAGITANRSVFYKEPLGIRRVLSNP